MLKHESCPAKRRQRALTVHDANYVFVRARLGAAAQGRSGSRAWIRDFSSAQSTTAWVATASSSTVESSARCIVPANAPVRATTALTA